MCIHKHLSSQRIPARFLKSAQQLGQDSPGCWAQVKLCKTSEGSDPNRMSLSLRQWRFPGQDCRKFYFSVEMPALKQPVWQEWHIPMCNPYGNWASTPYPPLNHTWILPPAPELIANNNPLTPQMHTPLTESLVSTFHSPLFYSVPWCLNLT